MATTSFFVVLLAAGSLAGPINVDNKWRVAEDQCATTCTESSNFRYIPSKTYEFKYETDIQTHVAGASEERSSLHMEATAHMEVLSKCELALRLTDVSLQDTDPDNGARQHVENALDFKRALQEHPLRFSFQDGRIEELCPDDEEEPWVLNIKRGILSAFQNTMPSWDEGSDMDENDVTGRCPSNYEVIRTEYDRIVVGKKRDLIKCSDRHGYHTSFQANPYLLESGIQSLPIMKSSHECEQELHRDGRLISSECKEKHVFRPFSKHENGALTEAQHKLTFGRLSEGTRTPKKSVTRRENLFYDHHNERRDQEFERREAEKTLKDLCRTSKDDVRPESPHLFAQFIQRLRSLDDRSLWTLHRDITGGLYCEKAITYFGDAIPGLGTTAAVKLVKDLILRDKTQGIDEDVLITAMGFIPYIQKEMLAAVKPLLEANKSKRKSILVVSSMVNTYCRTKPECLQETEVQEIIEILVKKLGYNCAVSTDIEHETVLMALKGIGNSGKAERAKDTLARCLKNDANPMEIRVAAVQAFRRLSCSLPRESLMRLLEDEDVDAELRIHAYWELMRCPTTERVRKMKEILEKENVNQVGSFIWSHLTNLVETASPVKQELREIVEDLELKRMFDIDRRKFSKNVELSLFSETINAGVMFESNLIWSAKSYMPRSVMANLTVDMFGKSINLLESGIRMEGFEHMVELAFNPAAKERNPYEKAEVWRKESQSNKIDKFASSYPQKNEDEPYASVYIKMMGNELRYDEIRGIDKNTVKEKFNFLKFLLDLSKEHNSDIARNALFLDTTLKVPTINGMPLKLHVQGTMSMEMKVKGKLDIRNVWKSPRSADIDGSFSPSGAIELVSEMVVDANAAKSGMKMISTLHSSTSVAGKVELKDGKVFAVEVHMPKEQMEVLDVETHFFMSHRNRDREQQMIQENYVEKAKCIDGALIAAVGLELCGEVKFPVAYKKDDAPWFPLTGPASAKLTLHKRDTLTAYRFEAKYIRVKTQDNGATDTMRIHFNTPGSRIDRELTAELTVRRPEMSVNGLLKTPWKKIALDGTLKRTPELKKLKARITVDETKEYLLDAELQQEQNNDEITYKPTVTVSMPTREPISVFGEIKHKENRKLNFDITVSKLSKDPIEITGELNRQGSARDAAYRTEVELKSPLVTSKVIGKITSNTDNQGFSRGYQFTVNYKFPNGPQERLSMSSKLQNFEEDGVRNINIQSAFDHKNNPSMNYEVIGKFKKEKGSVEGTAEIGYGRTYMDKDDRLVINIGGEDKSADGMTHYRARGDVKCLKHGVDYSLELEHMNSPNQLKELAILKIGEVERKLDFDWKMESGKPFNVEGNMKLYYPGRQIEYHHKIQERQQDEYHHEMRLQLNPQQEINVKSFFKNHDNKELEAKIIVPNYDPIEIRLEGNPGKQGSAFGKVQVQGKTYSASASWELQPYHSAKGLIEVDTSERIIKASTSASYSEERYSGNVELQLDAKRSPENKIQLAADVKLSQTSPEFTTTIILSPELKFELSSNLRLTGDPLLHAIKRVEGDLKIISSFKGFEHQGGNFDLNYQKDTRIAKVEVYSNEKRMTGLLNVNAPEDMGEIEITAEVTTPFEEYERLGFTLMNKRTLKSCTTRFEAKMPSNKAIIVEAEFQKISGWKSIESSILINTPYRFLRKLNTDFEYNIENEITLSGKININDIEYEAGVTGRKVITREKTDLEFSAKVEHSQDPSKRLEFSVKYLKDVNTFSSSVTAQLNSQQRIHASVEKRRERTKRKYTLHLDIPVPDYMKHTLQIEYDRDSASISYSQNEKDPMFQAEMSIKKSKKMELYGKVSLDSPDLPMTPIEFTLKHEHVFYRVRKASSSVNIRYGKNSIHASQKFMMQPSKKFNAIVKLTTPFEGYEMISASANLQKKNKQYISHTEIKYSQNKKITLDTETTVDLPGMLKRKILLTTPYEPVERLMADVEYKKQGPRILVKGSASHGDNKAYEVSGEVNTGSAKKINLIIKSPWKVLQQVELDMQVEGTLRRFKGSTSASYHGEFKHKIALEGSLDLLENTGITFKLETPFDVRDFQFTLNHAGPMKNMQSSGSILLNSRTVIEVSSNLKINRGYITGSATVGSQIAPVRQLTLKLDYTGQPSDFTNKFDVGYDGKLIATSISFKKSQNSVDISGKLLSPFKNFENVNFELGQQGPLNDFTIVTKLTYALNQQIRAESQFKLAKDKVLFNVDGHTPFSGFEDLGLLVDVTTNLPNIDCIVDLKYKRDKNIRTTLSFEKSSEYMHGLMAWNTPCPYFKDFTTELDVRGTHKQFTSSINIVHNTITRINSRLDVFTGEGNKRIFAKVTTPHPKLNSLELDLTHEGTPTNFKVTTKCKYNIVTVYSAEFDVKMQKDDKEVKVLVTTPHIGFENIEAKVSYTGYPRDFTASAYMKYAVIKELHGLITFKQRPDALNLYLKVTTPFNENKEMIANLEYSGTLQAFKSRLSAIYGSKQITSEIEFKRPEFGAYLRVQLLTPYRLLAFNTFTFDMSGTPANMKASLVVELMGERYAMEHNQQMEDDTLNIVRRITSTKLPEPIEWSWGVSGFKHDDVSVSLSAKYGRKEVSIDSEFSRGPEKKLKVSVKTFLQIEGELELSSYGDGNSRLYKRSISVSGRSPKRTMAIKGNVEITENNFKHAAKLQWGNEPDRVFSYDMDFSKVERRRQIFYNGIVDIKSGIRNTQTRFDIKHIPDRQATVGIEWLYEADKDESRKLTTSVELSREGPKKSIAIEIKHPNLRQPYRFSLENVMDPRQPLYGLHLKVNSPYTSAGVETKIGKEDGGYMAVVALKNSRLFIDSALRTTYKHTRDVMSVSATVNYIDDERRPQIAELRAEINKLKNELKLSLESPFKSFDLDANGLNMGEGKHRYSITTRENNLPFVQADVDVDTEAPSFDVKIEKGNEITYVSGKYVTPSHLKLEAYKENEGRKEPEGLISVRLDKKRLLHNKLQWNPELPNKIKDLYNYHSHKGYELIQNAAYSIQTRLARRKEEMLRPPVIRDIKKLREFLQEDLDEIVTAIGKMYRTNEFYLRDIYDNLEKYSNVILNEVIPQLISSVQNLKASVSKTIREMEGKFEVVVEQTTERIKETRESVENAMNQISEKVLETAMRQREVIRQKRIEFLENINSVKGKIMQNIQEQQQKVGAISREYLQMLTEKIQGTFASFEVGQNLQALQKSIANAIPEFPFSIADKYQEAMYIAKEKLEELNRNLAEHEYSTYIKGMWMELAEQIKTLNEYFEVEENFVNLVSNLMSSTKQGMKVRLFGAVREYLQQEKSGWVVYNPEGGDLQYDLALPVQLNDLRTLPVIKDYKKFLTRARTMVDHMLPEDRWVMWDIFYQYKPSADMKDWIPPFKTHATLSGSQKYMTFDKKFYKYSSTCSYILARDFRDNNFTAIVKYEEKDGKISKSIIIMAGGNTIQIAPDYKVLLDDKRIELPDTKDTLDATRIGNKIVVNSPKGFSLECDLAHDRCTLSMAGWYYGKTAGLMGTYDNEPSDDFTMLNGRKTEDLDEFTSSWSVDGQCQSQIETRRPSSKPSPQKQKQCDEYFKDNSSPFRPCFKQVSPEPFNQMCTDSPETSNKAEASIEETCNVASFYVDECNRMGVHLGMPKKCVTCELLEPTGKTFGEQEKIRLKKDNKEAPVPNSADLVLVIEESQCNEDIAPKLNDIVHALESALQSKGLKNSRIAIVGYGNKNIVEKSPHTHTMLGEIFQRLDKLDVGMQNMDFISVNSQEDVYRALQFAAYLPYRAGVSKNIILLPCSECNDQFHIKYSDVQQLLFDRDIRLHTFIQENFNLKTSSPKSSYTFGVDRDAVFTHKHIKDRDMEGDRALRRHVIVPKNLCVALSLDTDGSIFNSQKLTESRTNMAKKFIDVFARVVAKKAEPSSCQYCECIADDVGIGMPVCRSCTSPKAYWKAYFRSESENNDKTDDDEDTPNNKIERKQRRKNRKPRKERRERPN